METPLRQIVEMIESYVGGLIDIASMPSEDKRLLKEHLKSAEEILLRNGNTKLQEVLSGLAQSILGRF